MFERLLFLARAQSPPVKVAHGGAIPGSLAAGRYHAAVIQMKTDREHLLQNGWRRLNMLNALLDRPGIEFRQIVPFFDADR